VDTLVLPCFRGLALLGFSRLWLSKERSMQKRYPPEFRRRVLEFLKTGRSVTGVAADLGVSSQANYNWRRHRQEQSSRPSAGGE
jgi:transposase-like protein